MKLQTIAANQSGDIRRETYLGREHTVVPVVILAEGVHNGILYTAEELQKFVETWNGRPLPVSHPKDSEGRYISANAPNLESVGVLFNAGYRAEEDSKPRIVGELWIDHEKANRVAPRVLEKIAGGHLEVSTGLFMDYENTAGVWNEESYRQIGRNFRPDHVALLPEGVGACSWDDGCGAPRVNAEEKPTFGQRVRLSLQQLASMMGMKVNDVSHGDIHSALQAEMDKRDNAPGEIYHYVQEVFDDHFIYRRSAPAGVAHLRLPYSVDEDGRIMIGEEPVEVRERTEWVEVNDVDISISNDREENEMKREEMIQALEAAGIDDKEWLESLTDCKLTKMVGLAQKPEAKPDAEPAANAQEPVKLAAQEPPKPLVSEAPKPTAPVTLEQFVAAAPPEVSEALESAIALQKTRKADLVEQVCANKANPYTRAELGAMKMSDLEKLAKLAGIQANYAVRGGGSDVVVDNSQIQTLSLPAMTFDDGK